MTSELAHKAIVIQLARVVAFYNYSAPLIEVYRSLGNVSTYRVKTALVTMAKNEKPVVEEVDGVERIRKEARPDFSLPPARKPLPKDIQTVLDNEETMWETISDGT